MKIYNLIVDSQPVLMTFSPIEIVERIMLECKNNGERPIDIWTSEVK